MDDAALAEPAERGYGSRCPTDATLRFAEAIEEQRPDPEFRDRCVDAFTAAGDPEIFHVGVRFPVKSACRRNSRSQVTRPSATFTAPTAKVAESGDGWALSATASDYTNIVAREPALPPADVRRPTARLRGLRETVGLPTRLEPLSRGVPSALQRSRTAQSARRVPPAPG